MSAIVPFDASSNLIAVPIPAAFTYNLESATFSLIDNSSGPAVATCSKTAKQVFSGYSVAQSAPSATYYVSTTGSDSNNGTSSGTPFLTMSKAITSANTGGVPTKIYVAAGTYYRSSSPNYTSVVPTVDIALVATGGRVIVGTFDSFTAPSKDGTYTNTYSYARSSVERVVDIGNLDGNGHYMPLTLAPSAAVCNITPGSWYTDGTTLYIQRADGAAVTATNTRVYLTAGNLTMGSATAVNLYIGSGDNGFSGFDFEGGQYGCLTAGFSASPGTQKIIVAEYCTFRYAGGRVSTSGNGVTLDTFYGWAWFFNCDVSRNQSDGFNAHNTSGTATMGIITVNCSGFDNGLAQSKVSGTQSCQGWTSHENCMGADFAGRYEGSFGNGARSINTTVSLLAGTYVTKCQGDLVYGGGLVPAAFQTDNTAVYYCFRTKAEMQGGQYAYYAVGGTIYLKQSWSSRAANCTNGGALSTW